MGSTLVAYSPRADAVLVELLQRRGIDAEAVAAADLAAAAAERDAAACILPLAAGAPALARMRRAAPGCRILVVADGSLDEMTDGSDRRILEALQAGRRRRLRQQPVRSRPAAPGVASWRERAAAARRDAARRLRPSPPRPSQPTARRARADAGGGGGLRPACERPRHRGDRRDARHFRRHVRRHISRAAAKVGVRGRAELVAALHRSN